MVLIKNIQYMLKYLLIISLMITVLLTSVTCGNNKVDITQADVNRLRDNWQTVLNTVNNGTLVPGRTYQVNLMLDALHTGNITSTENLTISFNFSESETGLMISPASTTVAFNETLSSSLSKMLTIANGVAVEISYTLTISLSSKALEETLTFDLNVIVSAI